MRVIVADDHQIMREGLSALLAGEAGVSVVDEVADGYAAIEAARTLAPDVVVMDVAMPGLNGIEAIRSITEDSPHVRVLCLSMYSDQHVVSDALQAGAAGYLLKECAGSQLVDAIRTVARGRTYLSPAVAGGVVREYVALAAAEMYDRPRLTTRERQILQLIAEGHGTKAIAARLGISAKTVGTHREHIMAKLDVHSVAGLTKYAIRHGITTPESGSPDLSARR